MSKLFTFVAFAIVAALSTPSFVYGNSQDAKARKLISKDLNSLSTFEFHDVSPLHKEFFDGETSKELVTYFNERIKDIVWQELPKDVIAAGGAYGIIAIGSLYSHLPQVRRIGTLIHEAAHTEKWGREHNICGKKYSFRVFNYSYRFEQMDYEKVPVPFCDDTALSPTGLEYVFLRSVVNSCSNCSEELKLLAKITSVSSVLIKISDKAAAEKLIIGSNPNPEAALREMDYIIRNKKNSGLNFDDWLQQCMHNNSCLNEPKPAE